MLEDVVRQEGCMVGSLDSWKVSSVFKLPIFSLL